MGLHPTAELYQQKLDEYESLDEYAPHKRRGELEHDIWNLARVVERHDAPLGGQRAWLQKRFGGHAQSYEIRSVLIKMGDCAEPLWEALDARRISHCTAGRIARRSRSVKGQAKRKEAISEMLRDSFGIPSISSTNGLPAKMVKFVKTVEDATNAIIEDYAPGLEQDVVERMRNDLLESVRIALGDFKAALNRERKGYKQDIGKVGALRFARACEVLSLPGVYGKPIDIQLARRARAQRLKHLHPDHNPGERNPDKERELHAVLEAFELLEKYHQQQTEETNGNQKQKQGG